MKKFQFRLQKVLETKERRRDKEKTTLASLQQQLAEQEKQLQEKEAEIARWMEKMTHLENDAVARYQAYTNYLNRLNQEARRIELAIQQTRQAIDRQREKLLQLQKEVRVLENLREKEYQEYLQEFRRLEQAQLDELATLNHSQE